jgi:hypothetical protein
MAEATTGPGKGKGTRTVKPVYAVMSVQDDSGQTIKISKDNVTVHSVHKDADELLKRLDGDGLPKGSFYKRIALS